MTPSHVASMIVYTQPGVVCTLNIGDIDDVTAGCYVRVNIVKVSTRSHTPDLVSDDGGPRSSLSLGPVSPHSLLSLPPTHSHSTSGTQIDAFVSNLCQYCQKKVNQSYFLDISIQQLTSKWTEKKLIYS